MYVFIIIAYCEFLFTNTTDPIMENHRKFQESVQNYNLSSGLLGCMMTKRESVFKISFN